MKIGKKLRSLRVENNLSVIQIAEKLKISESTYRKYEADKKSPDLNLLEKLAIIHDKRLIEFFLNVDKAEDFNIDELRNVLLYCEMHIKEVLTKLYKKNK